jgi:glycosyltransferase involved in cell wall biosynthesis
MDFLNSYKTKKKQKNINLITEKIFKRVKIQKPISSCSKKFERLYKYILFITILISILLFIFYFIFKYKANFPKTFFEENKSIGHYKVNDSMNEETCSKVIQDFIIINQKNTLIYGNKYFQIKENPKISVILSVRNGEAFIRAAIRSVQNQDFHDIEIIIVDDASEDKSVQVIKELMDEDKRISLMQNKENKGILYTRAIGILKAKGKYMLILDVDDLFAVENAFSIIYEESENNNLDMLGFGATQGTLNFDNFTFTHDSYHNYIDTPILHQPELSARAYEKNNGFINGFHDVVWGYLYKTELFRNVILNDISDRFMNEINNNLDDLFYFFILTRRAKSLKYIKKALYVTVQWKKTESPSVKYFNEEKKSNRLKYRCLSNLSFPEFLLIKSLLMILKIKNWLLMH